MRQVVQEIAENFKTSIISGRAREKVRHIITTSNLEYFLTMQYACSTRRTFFNPLYYLLNIVQVFDFVGINNINYAGSHGTDIKMVSTTQGVTTNSEIVSISSLHNYVFSGLTCLIHNSIELEHVFLLQTEEQGSYQPAQQYAPMMNQVQIGL